MVTKLVEKRDNCMRQAAPSHETLKAALSFLATGRAKRKSDVLSSNIA